MSKQNPPSPTARLLLDAAAIERALKRIAHEIIERNPEPGRLAIIGIPSRGVVVAERLAAFVQQFGGAIVPTRLTYDLENRTLILADDVAFTGRTCRAAMDALADFGRPAKIQYAVLIDRGHRELPIRADYVGKNAPTSLMERVYVRFSATDGTPDDAVWLDSTPGSATHE
jgi:pyrimidine operon attenuation protein/uracil phosphoribosyltransferase